MTLGASILSKGQIFGKLMMHKTLWLGLRGKLKFQECRDERDGNGVGLGWVWHVPGPAPPRKIESQDPPRQTRRVQTIRTRQPTLK